MPKLAANLSMLWNELDFLERFAAASKAGFSAVEYLFPYAYEKQQLVDKLGQNGLSQVLHNLPAGDWAKGDRGIACQPERRGEFRDGVGLAIEYAKALGCTQLNCLVGIAPAEADVDALHSNLVDNLKSAAAELGKQKIKLLVEPINTRDIPGFFVCRTKQALELFADVASPNLWLQYDIYHMQIMEGDLGQTIKANLPKIAHVQIADNPGRNEPGTGEIHHPFLFDLLDREGYKGHVGCEYKPRGRTDEGLIWAKPYL
jgi:hydroxypyruvate isomerase